jgi:hypothetical protein
MKYIQLIDKLFKNGASLGFLNKNPLEQENHLNSFAVVQRSSKRTNENLAQQTLSSKQEFEIQL